jgi:hypothetical protein
VPTAGLAIAADGQHYHLAGSLVAPAHSHSHYLSMQQHQHHLAIGVGSHSHYTPEYWTQGSVNNRNADSGSSFSAAEGGHPHWVEGRWANQDGAHTVDGWTEGANVLWCSR